MHRSPSTPSTRRRQQRLLALPALVALALLLTACPITEVITPDPTFTVSPDALTLGAQVGQSASGQVTIQNTGSAAITLSITPNATWLQVTPSSLPLAPGESGVVSITVTCSAAGTDSGTVSAAAGGTTRAVTVDRSCTAPPPTGAYDIRVETFGAGFTPDIEAVFDGAAARWEQVITGDVQDLTISGSTLGCSSSASVPDRQGVTIDDILIDAVIESIDGPGGILGSAGPCIIRGSGSANPTLSVYGTMRFDSADVAGLIAANDFETVILHEMGHVLGIGTLWDSANLLDFVANPTSDPCRLANDFTVPPTFNGTEAVIAWGALGGSGDVPVEDEFGAGTQCGHWDEQTFADELMTGFLSGTVRPMADLTIASLQDLGYTVNRSAAEPYTLPACSPNCLRSEGAGLDIAAREIVLLPRFEIGPDGTLERLDTAR